MSDVVVFTLLVLAASSEKVLKFWQGGYSEPTQEASASDAHEHAPDVPSVVTPAAWVPRSSITSAPSLSFWTVAALHHMDFLATVQRALEDQVQTPVTNLLEVAHLFHIKRKKCVVILGETHKQNGGSNWIPVSDFLMKLLEKLRDFSVEFMIEDHDADPCVFEPDDVQMTRVRELVRPCMPTKATRWLNSANCSKHVHYSWLDVQRGGNTVGEQIFNYAHAKEDELQQDWLKRDRTLQQKLQSEDDVRYFLLGGTRAGAPSGEAPSLRLQSQCAKAGINLNLIHDSFQEVLREDQTSTMQRQAYLAQRFAMDAYTICRLFRRPSHPQKRARENYLIYEGFWHLRNQVRMLRKLGFRAVQGPVPWLSGKVREERT